MSCPVTAAVLAAWFYETQGQDAACKQQCNVSFHGDVKGDSRRECHNTIADAVYTQIFAPDSRCVESILVGNIAESHKWMQQHHVDKVHLENKASFHALYTS